MAITRIADVDDDGSNALGTVHNNAWKTLTIYDVMDARWSVATTLLTGTQNNLTYGEADVIRCNNSSALTITGIAAPASPAKPGKPLIVLAAGTGNVFLSHQNANSQASARLVNFATSAATPLAAGLGAACYVYDNAISRWRLVSHEQGGWITPTISSSFFGAVGGGSWIVDVTDVVVLKYLLKGRTLFFSFYATLTSITGTVTYKTISNGAWGGFTIAGGFQEFPYRTKNSTADTNYRMTGLISNQPGETAIRLYSDAGGAGWVVGTNDHFDTGNPFFEVQ